jgi:hypothetical protein
MGAWDVMRKAIAKPGVWHTLNRLALRRRSPDFICNDCERWQRCGLPPDSNCLARAEQLARHDGRVPRRTALRDWQAWGY